MVFTAKRVLNRRQHARFASGGDPPPVAEVGVAFGDVLFRGDVAGGAFAVAGDADERIGTRLLRGADN